MQRAQLRDSKDGKNGGDNYYWKSVDEALQTMRDRAVVGANGDLQVISKNINKYVVIISINLVRTNFCI